MKEKLEISKKKVLIINTGGTIGMKNTSKGYTPVPGFLREAMTQIADLYREGFPAWELKEMSPLLDSSNMSVEEWNKIAELVYTNYNEFDGFVILHGTNISDQETQHGGKNTDAGTENIAMPSGCPVAVTYSRGEKGEYSQLTAGGKNRKQGQDSTADAQEQVLQFQFLSVLFHNFPP